MLDVTLQHLSGERAGAVETFRVPLRLGRAEGCQVLFGAGEGTVSGSHAELRASEDGQGVVLVDLGSRNGVFLDGARVEGSSPVRNGAQLELGVGGPRLQLRYEQAAGISFSRMRKDTKRLGNGSLRKIAATDEAVQTYSEAELFGEDSAPKRLAPSAAFQGGVLGLVVLVLAMLLGLALIAFVILG